MRGKVVLICKKNQVNHEVEIDQPRQYKTNDAKSERRLWYVILTVTKADRSMQHYGFIDINSQGQFVGYSVFDEISGMELHVDPGTFSESFTSFIAECVEVAIQHPSYLKAVGL